jgi:hypothetical protein
VSDGSDHAEPPLDVELVPGERPSHHGPEDARTTRSVPLDAGDGHGVVIEQEPVGFQNVEGGGEHPQPARAPTPPAPGSVDDGHART